ncbi:hypothetical protein RDI58_001209 [Solanum bulbocastanum]|uniref:Uncharacterized protein n=1 Tax=Solanum bulbocastanum TaxID=147425 RepID=A0AAN8UC83_SOLBU
MDKTLHLCALLNKVMQYRECQLVKEKNYSVPSSGKNELAQNKNLMKPGFDPIEVDMLFSHADLENAIA